MEASGQRLFALVFFATGRGLRPWVIRTATGCPLVHVAIGYGGTALNPTIAGDHLHLLTDFAHRHPRLVWCFEVPLRRPIVFTPDPRPRRIWPTVRRWLRGGRGHTRDCVQEVAKYLRQGGVKVPGRLTTPGDLFDFLRSEGYHLEDFG